MEIDYTNSRSDHLAHVKASQSAVFSRLAFQHYSWVAYWGVMAGLGVYVSLFSDLIFMAAIFAAMYLFYFTHAVPFSRVLRSSADQTSRLSAPKRIHLRIDDDGLHETVEGQVESFAPWSAFQRFAVVDEHLLIELSGDLWANIPRSAVTQGHAAFDDLVALLRSRELPEHTGGMRAATPTI